MTPDQITLVRNSFALVEPIAPQAAALFYDHLFQADPSLRALFRGDMVQQGASLMSMIGSAVQILDQPQKLTGVLQAMGRRHVAYGVRDAHYAPVGAALLLTLKQGLGEAFTPEVNEAWTTLYGVISTTMQDAAAQVTPAA
jgi:hemoglobin-like flavoprotein